MYRGFGHIRQLDEDCNGLRVTLEEVPEALLRKDHPRFQRLCDVLVELLQETKTDGVPRPTWVAVDNNGVITEVRLVLGAIPLSASRDDSGGYLIVFPFTNVSRKLRPEHPRFQEFERYLQLALEHETPLEYVASAEDFYTIDDMVPVQRAGRPPQDAVVADVAGGKVVAEQRH
jgi:hypothetical protein